VPKRRGKDGFQNLCSPLQPSVRNKFPFIIPKGLNLTAQGWTRPGVLPWVWSTGLVPRRGFYLFGSRNEVDCFNPFRDLCERHLSLVFDHSGGMAQS